MYSSVIGVYFLVSGVYFPAIHMYSMVFLVHLMVIRVDEPGIPEPEFIRTIHSPDLFTEFIR